MATTKATPTFLGIPRELRDHIYSFVWCDPGYVRLGNRVVEHQWKYEDDPTFPEAPEPRYPPVDAETRGPEAPEGGGEEEIDTDVVDDGEQKAGDADGKDDQDVEEVVPIEFDVKKFLRSASFDDFDFDDDDDDDDYDYSDGDDNQEERSRPRYKLDLLSKSVTTSLLRVNKQIYAEALPALYANTTFTLDADGTSSVRLLHSLPQTGRENVQSIALTWYAFQGDDGGSRRAWSGSYEEPLFRSGTTAVTMVTPFGAFLASQMPRMKRISFFVPYAGEDDWYTTWAPKELGMLLAYEHIEELQYVYFGEKAAAALRETTDDDCYDRLTGLFDGAHFAPHEFNVVNPQPRSDGPFEWTEEGHQAALKRLDDECKYVEHEDDFGWYWVDREIEMGGDGNVQAVIAHYY